MAEEMEVNSQKGEKRTEIFVCQSGTCRAKGAEAVQMEIEELANVVGGCPVRPTGCIGYCSQGPNAVIATNRGTKSQDFKVEVQIRSFEASTRVVENATGFKPQLDDPEVKKRFAKLREARSREEAKRNFHWNAALSGLAEQAALDPQLKSEFEELLGKAGYTDGIIGEMPKSIENYTKWTVESITPVSKHSSIYHLSCKDRNRGTPHPRGRGRMPNPITWHTTLLAEIGRNSEGPLPWIEREYTPISSAKQWEQGKCDILIKIYNDGIATSWLHASNPSHIWLSEPIRTLHVPSLTPDTSSFEPSSILLLLAGTGVVTLPQILYHRDPLYKLGISTPKRKQLRIPIDLILSCREDDVLMISQIAEWCRAGEAKGIRNCTLLLTSANAGSPIYPDVTCGDQEEVEKSLLDIANIQILKSRMNSEIVSEAAERMIKPCRVIVSGPEGFNAASRELLKNHFEEEEIVVLSA